MNRRKVIITSDEIFPFYQLCFDKEMLTNGKWEDCIVEIPEDKIREIRDLIKKLRKSQKYLADLLGEEFMDDFD